MRRVVRDTIGRLQNIIGELKSADAEMYNILNEYLAGVFTNEDMNNIPIVKQPGEEQQ